MIVITGAAGFIGSCIVSRFNEMGRQDLILVDTLKDDRVFQQQIDLKEKNLQGKKYARFIEKKDFLDSLISDKLKDDITCIIHMGACSTTTLQDKAYFEENNFEYSRRLAEWTIKRKIRMIYASSAATYGDGSGGYSDRDEATRQCRPLNLYGQSKHKFDLWVLDAKEKERFVGLKFFNVFGPNEYHKRDMRSVVAKAYPKVASEGRMNLFKSYNAKYADGEQKRDFIYVKDAVDVVMYFFDHPQLNGIYNVGTGKARTWNELAAALFAAVGKPEKVDYIPMPEDLKQRYQYFTQADMTKLRQSGYQKPFTPLEEAVKDYVQYLKENLCI